MYSYRGWTLIRYGNSPWSGPRKWSCSTIWRRAKSSVSMTRAWNGRRSTGRTAKPCRLERVTSSSPRSPTSSRSPRSSATSSAWRGGRSLPVRARRTGSAWSPCSRRRRARSRPAGRRCRYESHRPDRRRRAGREGQDRSALIGIVGLGYVGLPLAMEFARAGFRVVGFDVSQAVVDSLTQGRSHVQDVASADVARFAKEGAITATTDLARLREPDVVSICVPTPLSKTKDPDVSYVLAATNAVKRALRRGQLIVLESTTYPGTTRELLLPALEQTGSRWGRTSSSRSPRSGWTRGTRNG